jgi:hypothetical protein
VWLWEKVDDCYVSACFNEGRHDAETYAASSTWDIVSKGKPLILEQ